MRIISGQFKGHRLVPFQKKGIRPMTDYTKESLFNSLRPYLNANSIVLDLFAGTGSLGLEALSWGAKQTVFVDTHTQVVEQNIQKLGILKPQGLCKKMDAFKFIKTWPHAFDIVLIDPPFKKKLAHPIMQAIAGRSAQILTPQAWVVIESAQDEPLLPQEYEPHLQLLKQKKSKDKWLSFFSKTPPQP